MECMSKCRCEIANVNEKESTDGRDMMNIRQTVDRMDDNEKLNGKSSRV